MKYTTIHNDFNPVSCFVMNFFFQNCYNMYPVVGKVGQEPFPPTDEDDEDDDDGDGVAPRKKSLDPEGLPKFASKSPL